MTLQEYYDLLSRHDWYYAFSDDGSVWGAGEVARDRLLELAKLSKEHEQLMKRFSEHYFSGKPWGTPEQPKPVRPE